MTEVYSDIRANCADLIGKKFHIRFRLSGPGIDESPDDSWMTGRIDNIFYYAGKHIEISSGMESIYIFSDGRVSYQPSSLNAYITVSVVSLTVHHKKYDIPRP